MKVLALQGSPRPDGNTAAVLDIVLGASKEAGADVETIHIAGLKNITGCQECFGCQDDGDVPGCVVQDDMQAVHDKVVDADVIVWATPVFCWSPAWPLKVAMDRFYCMFRFDDEVIVTKSFLEGKKTAAVITAGGGANDGADLITETCKRMADFAKTEWLGAFVAGRVVDPDGIRASTRLTARARDFGKTLVS